MSQAQKHIVVLGAGESGLGAAKLALHQGYSVWLSDAGMPKPDFQDKLKSLGIAFEVGQHSLDKILSAHQIIKSPGIPDTAPVVLAAKEKGISVISEIEFAYQHTTVPVIGITGSNGKTTTTMLVHHMLQKAGLNAGLCGNIGNSMAAMVCDGNDYDYFVAELSSFQLDGIETFKPKIAILLNISPDHLDRYEYKMEKYRASKMRIALNQGPEDYFIYCAEDEELALAMAENPIQSSLLPFALHEHNKEGAYTLAENIIININKDLFTMSINDLALQGKHNLHNSMAAGITGKVLELRKELIRESLEDFQSVEHRLEPVINVHGISFINDSKATNVNATWYALESMKSPVVWIAGGVDKGNDYAQLEPLVAEKVKALVCLGKDNSKLIAAFGDVVDVLIEAESMAEAVHAAYTVGKKGDSVLLSPCCASFDLFESYEDRGRQFKEQVFKL